MNYERPELRDLLAADYALGAMPERARRRFERLMWRDVGLRRLAEDWDLALNRLSAGAPRVKPSARLWRGIERELGWAAAVSPFARWWDSITFWRLSGLAAAAAALALAVYIGAAPERGPTHIAVLGGPDAKPALVARLDADEGLLTLAALTPQEVAPDKSLELWLVPPEGAPRSLGLLGPGTTALELDGAEAAALTTAVLAVSLEPAGGSPTGAPTGTVLYTGAVLRAP